MSHELDARTYSALYGPTEGDRIRLGNTKLVVQVERDETSYGDEILGGCGKTYRDGMLSSSRVSDSQLDSLVSNVVVLDPVLGIIKTNIGIKEGRIVGIGRAGNPDIVDDIDLVVGPHTTLVPGEGLIATPGAVDSHVHLSSPAVIPVALSAGITTVIAMGSGGTFDVGNPPYHLERIIDAWGAVPINAAFLARAASGTDTLERQLSAGASGFKIHEDLGAHPNVIDTTLSVAEMADVAVALHSDSLNESGYLNDTLATIGERTVHAYHVEGSGGGHIPNILEIVSRPHIIPSSTTPTFPFAINTLMELFPMTMIVHRQSPLLPTDVALTRERIRQSTIEAENILHDLGGISITSSDSMGMGRIGELVRRTWQLASLMKETQGGPHGSHDNDRVLQYLAKYTINPAITHGISDMVGSLAPGKLADLVLWRPAFFGAKPEIVIKAGFVAWGVSADGAGSTRLGQPRRYRSYFGGLGYAPANLSYLFAAKQAVDAGLQDRVRQHVHPVSRTRNLSRDQMIRNTATPTVTVTSGGGPVLIDGTPVRLDPALTLPLNQLYHFA